MSMLQTAIACLTSSPSTASASAMTLSSLSHGLGTRSSDDDEPKIRWTRPAAEISGMNPVVRVVKANGWRDFWLICSLPAGKAPGSR